MFYEEKLIDGIMCYRTKPDGEWTQYPTEELSRRYDQVEAERRASRERVAELEEALEDAIYGMEAVYTPFARYVVNAKKALKGGADDTTD